MGAFAPCIVNGNTSLETESSLLEDPLEEEVRSGVVCALCWLHLSREREAGRRTPRTRPMN